MDDVEVVGEARDGVEAVELLESRRLDVVFLDIRMPEADAFEVLESLDPAHRPAIIFVTAYDAYAIRAFEVHAVDYLLKPFDEERFAMALARARERLDADPVARARPVDRLVEELARRRVRRLRVRTGNRVLFVNVDDVAWMEAAGNYVRVHALERSHLVRDTLSALVERFEDRFARIHRSIAVALSYVAELKPLPTGDAVLRLVDGTELRASRTYRQAFEDRMRGE